MKRIINKTMAFGLVAMLCAMMALTSCSKGVDMGKYIPSDAMVVMNMDMDQLWDKADIDNIDQISFVKLGRQELRSENPQMAALVDAILKDPTSTGLHLKKDVTLWFGVSNNDLCGSILATMHNEKKFEEFLNDFAKDNGMAVKFDDKDGWRVAKMTNEYDIDNYVVFNGEVAVLAFDEQQGVDRLANLKKDESLAGDKKFRQYWSNRSELSMWISVEPIMNMAEMSGEDVMGVAGKIYGEDDLNQLKNSSIAMNIIFDKGVMRMMMTTQGIGNKVFEKYMRKFNGDLVDYMPEKTYAVMTFAYNLDEVMKALEAQEDLDINPDEEIIDGVTVRDIASAFGGSMIINLFDFEVTDGSVMPMLALAADVKKADIVKKLFEEIEMEPIEENVYDFGSDLFDFPIYIYWNDKAVFVTNSKEAVDNFKKGTNKKALEGVAKKAKAGNYLYADLDINHYPAGIKALIPENITALMGKYLDYTELKTDNTTAGEWDFYIKDRSQNSLLATLHFVDDNLVELGNLAESLGGGSDCPEVTDTFYVDEDYVVWEDED